MKLESDFEVADFCMVSLGCQKCNYFYKLENIIYHSANKLEVAIEVELVSIFWVRNNNRETPEYMK